MREANGITARPRWTGGRSTPQSPGLAICSGGMPNPITRYDTSRRLEAMAAGRSRDDEAVAAALLHIMRMLGDLEDDVREIKRKIRA